MQFIAGILTQQVELSGERLEIGIVTHAKYIRETIGLLGKPSNLTVAARSARIEPLVEGATAASAAVSASAMGVGR